MKVPDSHAHLTDRKFKEDIHQVIERAVKSGVYPIMVPSSPEEFPFAIKLKEKYDIIHIAAGVHPHEASSWDNKKQTLIEKAAKIRQIVAIGEIGLDYHYDFSPRETQKDVLKKQLDIAERFSLPVIIHSRESAEDLARILEEFEVAGVLHSFSEQPWLADFAIKRGFFISFSGMITFKWADFIRDTAKRVPLNRVLVETDSPYLAPVPYRGKRNEPAYVIKVAEKIAELRDLEKEELFKILRINYFRLFGGKDGEVEEKDKGD
ncbi:MAG: TatD family hydrolase [Candidatus Aminicenantes bacterium]|nr:TatD family hydrolase [Candidatus Aminicenantes bacterium]